MENNKTWNPWKPETQRVTSQEDQARTRAAADPALGDLFEGLGESASTASDDSDFLQDLDDRFRHNTSVPRETKAALSLDDTKRALQEMSKSRYETVRKVLFPKLLESAEANLPEGSLATRFLRAAVSGDKAAMREVVTLLDAPVQ